ncbi:hypothetical protein HDU96_002571 [Phlyctochytrium bullatum]|nr:hypothetical protein HDU96_002571 [Phlyctochytrium bullatum]
MDGDGTLANDGKATEIVINSLRTAANGIFEDWMAGSGAVGVELWAKSGLSGIEAAHMDNLWRFEEASEPESAFMLSRDCKTDSEAAGCNYSILDDLCRLRHGCNGTIGSVRPGKQALDTEWYWDRREMISGLANRW